MDKSGKETPFKDKSGKEQKPGTRVPSNEDPAHAVTPEVPSAGVALKKYIGAKTDVASVEAAEKLNDSQEEKDAHVASAAGDDLTVAFVVENVGELALKDVQVPSDEAIREAFTNAVDGTVSGVDAGTPQVTNIRVAEFAGNAEAQKLLKPAGKVVFVADLKAPDAAKLHADKAKTSGVPVGEDSEPVRYVPLDENGKPKQGEDGKPQVVEPSTPVESNEDQAHATTPSVPKIELIKKINGDDAETEDAAVALKPGEEAEVTFEVTNVGDVNVFDITIADETLDGTVGVVTDIKAEGSDSDVFAGPLKPGESTTFTGKLVLEEGGQYHADRAKAEGVPPSPENPDKPGEDQPKVPSEPNEGHAKTPSKPELELKKYINDNDAQDWDSAEELKPGEKATVKFVVTNTGNVDLFNVTLSDETVEGVGDVENITPEQIDRLNVGESAEFTGELTLPEDNQEHKDVAKAEGVPPSPENPDKPGEDQPKVPSNEDPAHAKTPGKEVKPKPVPSASVSVPPSENPVNPDEPTPVDEPSDEPKPTTSQPMPEPSSTVPEEPEEPGEPVTEEPAEPEEPKPSESTPVVPVKPEPGKPAPKITTDAAIEDNGALVAGAT
ncbi:DUF7507 domain-containing protein, partial [Corynebacterium lowii]